MLKNIRFIAVTISLLFLSVTASHAVVQLVDTETTGFRQDIDNNITSGVIATGSGLPGDYEVIMCSTASDGSNSFLDPTPDGWLTIDNGECGGSVPCIQGIFGRFDDSPDSTDITCNWTDQTSIFAAGSFRYRGVNIDDPIIAVACNTGGPQTIVIAPSVNTEPGSAVIVAFAVGNVVDVDVVVATDQLIEEGFFAATGASQSAGQAVFAGAGSFAAVQAGPTGDFDLGPSASFQWRACTIALRMAPTNIPTLSEWGMLAAAGGLMIAGVFFAVRRKRLQASA